MSQMTQEDLNAFVAQALKANLQFEKETHRTSGYFRAWVPSQEVARSVLVVGQFVGDYFVTAQGYTYLMPQDHEKFFAKRTFSGRLDYPLLDNGKSMANTWGKNLVGKYPELMQIPVPITVPRVWTEDETKDQFLGGMRSIATYWADEAQKGRTPFPKTRDELAEFLRSALHSVLANLDSSYYLVRRTHETDEAHHKEFGENWWPHVTLPEDVYDIAGNLAYELYNRPAGGPTRERPLK